MKKRMLSLLLAAALLCTGLTGCGTTYARREDTSSTLYVGEVGAAFPTSYMPWLSRDGVAPTIASMIFSTLLSYDDETGAYSPLLASDWCYVDREGNPIRTADGQVDYQRLAQVYGGNDTTCMVIRFELNPDATWSDGVPVTAEDVYFTFDLAANQARSNHAGALAWVSDLQHKYDNTSHRLLKQGVFTYDHGANERGYKIDEADRDRVFYFEVNKVLGAITPLVSTVLILPEHIYGPLVSEENPINSSDPTPELNQANQDPVGCGPFTLDREQTNSQEIVLHRRPDYYLHDEAGNDLYKVDTLRFILYQEINVAIYALKKGHIDVLDATISPNYRGLFSEEKGVEVLESNGLFLQTLVLNMNPTQDQLTDMRQLLTDVNFRRAIALAVDQDALIRSVLGGAGSTAPAGLFLPSQSDLYNPEADILSGPMEDRLAEANAILDGICPERDSDGYRTLDGHRISFSILGNPGEQETIEFLRILLQKIGVEVKFAAKGSNPESTYLYAGNFDMTIQNVTLSLSNADIMLNSHFVNLNRSSNYGRMQNDEVSALIETMRTAIDLQNKRDAIQAVQPVMAQQYYKIPLYCADVISVARTDHFTGWTAKAGSTAFSLESLQQLEKVN